jgi:hypothetical protein
MSMVICHPIAGRSTRNNQRVNQALSDGLQAALRKQASDAALSDAQAIANWLLRSVQS